MHLCEEHAKGFLNKQSDQPIASIAGVLANQLGQSKEELEELDQKECPVCGISFFEFRNSGRLGCPYDYTHFESDLQPLLKNVHDKVEHRGKRPKRAAASADSQAEMIQLRRDMEEAVEREDYERASEIRDKLRGMEAQQFAGSGESASGESADGPSGGTVSGGGQSSDGKEIASGSDDE